jgi:DNA polymerase-3 subunit delta'
MIPFLDEIIGQKKVKQSLYQIYSTGQLPQALLFMGTEGVGKFHTAIQFLKLLNSEIINNNKKIANQISLLNEPFVRLIFPLPRGKNETDDNPYNGLSETQLNNVKEQIALKSENPYHKINIIGGESIKISSIRDISSFTTLSYENIKYRLILIIDAHLMGEEAQNALLKNLEEPPEGVIYILTTTEENKILPTIKSRCWKINFSTLSDSELSDILIKYFDYKYDKVQHVSYFSQGSVNKSIYLLENNFDLLLNKTLNILRFSFAGWYNTAFVEFKEILKNSDYELLKIIIIFIYTWLNNLEKLRNGEANSCFEPFLDSLTKFNNKYPNVKVNKLLEELDILLENLDRNVNINIISANIIIILSNFTNN